LLRRNFVSPYLIFDNRYHENECAPRKLELRILRALEIDIASDNAAGLYQTGNKTLEVERLGMNYPRACRDGKN